MPVPDSPNIAVLTAGRDKPYALGLAAALIEAEIPFEFLGSNEVDSNSLHESPLVVYRNIRGDKSEEASLWKKMSRVLVYYCRLLAYGVKARPRLFHILWNNKFEWFDRTILMLFYRLCGRKIVLTAHNVNAGSRDGTDSFMNRLTLKIQYALSHHIFVHTERMKSDLSKQFEVSSNRISVIPFGMNSTVPQSSLDCIEARRRLGIGPEEKVLLFFGNIAPYKGLEHLVNAMSLVRDSGIQCRLVIAGRPKGEDAYWKSIEADIERLNLRDSISCHIRYIADEDTEIYFKAADALVLPYVFIFQSGVLFLGYNFGLPVLAADVGSLREEVVEGSTGFVFRPQDPEDLSRVIQKYFDSALYQQLSRQRTEIREFASDRYSWTRVAAVTRQVYASLLEAPLVRSGMPAAKGKTFKA